MNFDSKAPVVMIVDDDEEDLYLAERAFKACREGIKLMSVYSGTELFEYLNNSCNCEDEKIEFPDIILLDINMPKLNGFEVISKLRGNSAFAHIPVIMFTTSDSEEDVKRAYTAGANSYLCKSINADELKLITGRICEFWLDSAQLPKAA